MNSLGILLSDLYNLRGSDIEYNPVFFSYAVVTQKEAFLFVNTSQLTASAREALQAEEVKVTIKPYDELAIFISEQVRLMYINMFECLFKLDILIDTLIKPKITVVSEFHDLFTTFN